MAWIESHTVLMRHRKLAELSRALRLRKSYTLGHLHALWHAALEQQEDGDLSAWSDEFIADQADFPGDAPQFVRQLQEKGFLDGKMLHDWIDYAGKYLIGKYSSSNRDRLVEIWAKYQRVYGDKKASKQRLGGDKKVNIPNPPTNLNQPTITNQDALRLVLEKFKSLNRGKVPVSEFLTSAVEDENIITLIDSFGHEKLIADLEDVHRTGKQYAIGWFIKRWQNKGWERKDGKPTAKAPEGAAYRTVEL